MINIFKCCFKTNTLIIYSFKSNNKLQFKILFEDSSIAFNFIGFSKTHYTLKLRYIFLTHEAHLHNVN